MKTLKKNILLAGLLLVSVKAQAGITTHVAHIEKNVNADTEIFVNHEGRVFNVDNNRPELLDALEYAKENNLQVELEVEDAMVLHPDTVERIEEVRLLEAPVSVEVPEVALEAELNPMTGYSPSNVESLDKATEVFNSLNNNTKWFSQCFNRAHIWAKEMFNNYNIHSMKILIYYTKRYRREVSKKWWFHIAPMVSVNGDYYVMDREFTRNPVTDTEWEKIFTKKMGNTDYRCKKIDNIKEFYDEENTQNEFCNIQHTSMYYWEPNDMSRLDKTGAQKTDWVNWELRVAAKEAFRKWRNVYKEIKVSE